MKVTTATSCKQANMYHAFSFLLLASCFSNVFCQTARPPYPPGGPPPPPAQYPTPAPVQDYNPDIGQTNVGGYGVNKDHHLHLLSIQLLHQSKTTTLTLGRLMLGATASTKTPTATRWRRSSSRTSVSLIRRKLAGHKTRRSAVQLCTRTVPESSRPTLSASASM